MVYATLVVRRASSLNFMLSKPKLSTQLLQSQNRRFCTLATTPFPTKLSILRHSLSFKSFELLTKFDHHRPAQATRCLCKGTSQIFTRISLLPKLMAEAWLKHKLQVPSYMSCQNLKHETESTLAPRVEIYFEFFVASSCSWTTANPWKKCNSLSNQSLSEFIALNHIQSIEHMSVKEKICLSLLVMQVRECWVFHTRRNQHNEHRR